MEAAFMWLASLMETLGSFIPSWHHHEWQDVGVSVTRGKKIKILRPGIIFYWPFWTSMYNRTAVRQTKGLVIRNLRTLDGTPVACGCMVRYHIPREWVEEEAKRITTAALKALIETDDVDRCIVDEALGVLCSYITGKELQELTKDRKQINTDLTIQVRASLKPYGVYVERIQLTDFTHGVPLIHIGMTPEAIEENN